MTTNEITRASRPGIYRPPAPSDVTAADLAELLAAADAQQVGDQAEERLALEADAICARCALAQDCLACNFGGK